MTYFRRALNERNSNGDGRRWLYVPYDQCTDAVGPLSREDPRELGIILVENPWKAAQRPYHKQKLALILGNLRHFALEQAERGVAVRHLIVNGPYRHALERVAAEYGRIRVMRPAERELRVDLQPLVESGVLEILPHEGWLTSTEQFNASHPNGSPWLMERFYRYVRKATGILMADGKPVGGQYNFDVENRRPWKGRPSAPAPPTFQADACTEEVISLIEQRFAHHPGRLSAETLPCTAADAQRLWSWAKQECMQWFGDFEDAMSSRSSGLFHSRTSALLNICRLLPLELVRDVETLDIPIAAKEGFIRQVLGWREFMRHVHEATDGFRQLPNAAPIQQPGDGGYKTWTAHAWPPPDEPADGGATPSSLDAHSPLPPAFWGEPSGLNCIDTVVAGVWEKGWSHHITRLMVLSNLATLLDVSPRELTDWFWVAYIDAYDWVVEPNVLGMSTFGTGRLFTTKPYISGANYIHRMSDFCEGCQFDPKKNCPFSILYWAFLDRHRDVLESNQRLAMPYRTLRTRKPDGEEFIRIQAALARGEKLRPRLEKPRETRR